MNFDPHHASSEPVENAYWQDPPTGRYEIFVTNYSQKDEFKTSREYVVRVKQPGNMTFYRGRTDRPGEEASRWPPRRYFLEPSSRTFFSNLPCAISP